jgi:hypothetical protein
MAATARFLVLTEDSGKQAHPTVQHLARAALKLALPGLDTRLVELSPLPGNEAAIRAMHANRWKEKRPTPERTRLLSLIAGRLREPGGFVIFHVDSDAKWSQRSSSENRQVFESIIRAGVKQVLLGLAPNPIGRHPRPLSEPEAVMAVSRLFVVHPCYSIESWLYQATQRVTALCTAAHQCPGHLEEIARWAGDRTVLDEVLRPKDDVLPCVGDQHNEELAGVFPAREVYGAGLSWHEFVGLLEVSDGLKERLGVA